ncbi:MAG: mevalonate kinase [Candidatus Micrarchaeota archaeon]|nr:MAG: mevalonate kinase [Candidatus Micrarchaeota archaeon]
MFYGAAAIKLGGEHSVVYEHKALAAGLSLYARAESYNTKGDRLEIELPDLNKQISIRLEELDRGIEETYKPLIYILNELSSRYSIELKGLHIRISSDIPIQRGLASSAAISVAITAALISHFSISLKEEEFIELSRLGEIVAHNNKNAGKIDIPTSFYGGVILYNKGNIKRYRAKSLPILVIDTGNKLPTSVTVAHVKAEYEKDKERVESIFNAIDDCVDQMLRGISLNNLDMIGEAMFRNHDLLRELGVSNDNLDLVVEESRKDDAILGAKLSGGGGGGIAIALYNPNKDISSFIDLMQKDGFKVIRSEVCVNPTFRKLYGDSL